MQSRPPEDEARAEMIALAAEIELAVELAEPDAAPPAAPRVGAAEIWRAAALADPVALERVGAAAAHDARTAKLFAAELERHALVDFPILRAADTGERAPRRSGAWMVEVLYSEARPERCFIVVSVPQGGPAPSLLAVRLGETFATLALPAPEDGVIQVALDRSDMVAVAVADRRATLTLR
ncbi:MAG: hypothetical protein AAGI34_12580 [Pseudomonadota bacterium]